MTNETNGNPQPYGRRVASSQSPWLPAGFRLRGNRGAVYTIHRVLGSGGFGVTYEAYTANGQRVAIKELFPSSLTVRAPDGTVAPVGDSGQFNKMMESFHKEIGVLYKLNNAGNFVKIYDYFYANNTAYYAMEYVEGDTLKEYIKKHGTMDPVQWEQPFLQLMQDIGYLHANGVIHRDIAPDNIKITAGGSLKLIDFGLARPYMMKQGMTVNLKPGFAPLEQYQSHGQGTYTDIYALAATMYYCFTGKVIPDAYERKIQDRLAVPGGLGIPLPYQQEQALLRALAVDYRQRFQTMQEFAAAYATPAPSAPPEGPGRQEDNELLARIRASYAALRQAPLMPALACGLFLIAMILELVL